MRNTYHKWTIKEINWLRDNCYKYTQKQASEILSVPLFSIKNACHKYGIKFPKRGFKKGHKTWNKGKTHDVGHSTRFKKGNQPHNTRNDFDTRIEYEENGRPYKFIRVSLGKWMPLHRYIWELHNGPAGKGIIRFKDGNSLNCEIENLMLISRADNARLNALIRKPRTKKKLIAY